MKLLEGKVILVTGGGGGIGRAHALAIAEQGAKVVVNDLGSDVHGRGADEAAAEMVASEIRAQGGEAIAQFEDISTWEGARRAVRSGVDAFGKLDGLLNNAGNQRRQELADLTEEDFDSLIRVHLKGSFACTVHACHYWRERHWNGDNPRASVVNTFSDAVLIAFPNFVAYGAAKAGILHLTTAGSREAINYGVRINAYGPRGMTRQSQVAYANAKPIEASDKPHPKDPGNSSPLVTWLLSDESDHVSGQVFQTTGGGIARCTPWTPQAMVWPADGAVRFMPEEVGPVLNAAVFNARFPDLTLAEPPGFQAEVRG